MVLCGLASSELINQDHTNRTGGVEGVSASAVIVVVRHFHQVLFSFRSIRCASCGVRLSQLL